MFQDNMYLVLYEKKFICTFVLTHCLCIRYLVSNDEYAAQQDKITLTIEYLEGPAYILKFSSSSISQKSLTGFSSLRSQNLKKGLCLTHSVNQSPIHGFQISLLLNHLLSQKSLQFLQNYPFILSSQPQFEKEHVL